MNLQVGVVRITADHINSGSTDSECCYDGGTANEQNTTPKIKVLGLLPEEFGALDA